MKKFTRNNYHYFFFIIFFIIQLFIYKDYGFSNDDGFSRINGLVAYNYIIEKFNISIFNQHPNLPNFLDFVDRDYGVAFELPLVFIEKILNLNDNNLIFFSRHYLVSLSFFFASIYFYLTLNKFFNKEISLLGTLIFIFHPRIFAHSFYNTKDIGFLVFFTISNYYLISFFLKQNFKNILLLSLFVSLSIGTRPMGIIIPILFIFFFLMHNFHMKSNNKFYFFSLFIFSTSLFTIIFWPFLWEDPARFVEALKSMGKFRFVGEVFFNGEYFVAKYMPWYYIPAIILITTPIFYIFIFFVGTFLVTKKILTNLINLKHNNENIWKNELDLFLIYSFIIVFLTIGSIIELSATVYTGWRQIFFIYPSIIFISIYGLNYFLSIKKISKYVYIILLFLILNNLKWIYQNHPYQYTFYNSIITKKKIKDFELDYYGLSNLEILKKIIQIREKDIYNIYVFSVSPYHYSLNMIDKENLNKYKFVKNINDADFILTNHYYQKKDYKSNKHPQYLENYLNKNFTLIYEIKSNNVRINSIYEKKK